MKKLSFFLLPIFCYFYTLFFLQTTILAKEKSYVEYKEWSELSQDEKDGFNERWTEERINKVIEALKEGKALPGFINKMPVSEEEIKRLESLEFSLDKAKNYDLRGIPLDDQDLKKVNLPFVNLEGAKLSGTNLEGADLFEANLRGADLSRAILHKAVLSRAKLQGTDLSKAHLEGADLSGADLRGANLVEADLQRADLFEANLQEANLSYANLEEAVLSGANLQDTELFNADFDWTYLWRANFGEAKDIRYVVWGGKRSFRITEEDLEDLKADRIPKEIINKLESIKGKEFEDEDRFIEALKQTIGDEKTKQYESLILSYALTSQESQSFYIGEEKAMNFKEDFQNAEITYRDLNNFYENERLDEIAQEFNYRGNEVETKGSPLPLRILRTVFLKWAYGYGSRPIWLIWYSLGVVVVFTILFALLNLLPKTRSGIYRVRKKGQEEDEYYDEEEDNKNEERLSFRNGRIFIECFYFSLFSFATFGFDIVQPRQWLEFFRLKPVKYKPVGWARIIVGIEAAFGIYVIALLLMAVVGYL
jgi:hypothetical protein